MAVPKPTIPEYDDVYGGLRQQDLQAFVKLRTWILDGGSGPGPIENVTFNALVTLLNTNSTVPGQLYQITDFAQRQEIPNTAPPVFNPGSIEPLTVMASSSFDLFPWAWSGVETQDQIIYDIFNADFGADKGRIMYRKDVDRNIEAWFDWRSNQFRRWETAPASGIFTVLTDNGNAFVDFFAVMPGGGLGQNISIAVNFSFIPVQNNITIDSFGDGIYIKGNCADITIQATCRAITIGNGCVNNTILNGTVEVTIGDNCNENTIGSACSNLILGNFSFRLTLGSNLDVITFGQSCDNIIVEDNVSDTTFGNQCGASTIRINSQGNQMMDNVRNREINSLDQNRVDHRNRTQYNISYDFGASGGGIGANIMSDISISGQAVYTTIRVTSPLVGIGAELAIGFSTDGFAGLQAFATIVSPVYDGSTNVGRNDWTEANFSDVMSANQNIIGTVANAAITSGVILIQTTVLYIN